MTIYVVKWEKEHQIADLRGTVLFNQWDLVVRTWTNTLPFWACLLVHKVGQKYPPHRQVAKNQPNDTGEELELYLASAQLRQLCAWKMLEVMFNCSLGFILVEVENGDGIKFDFVPLTCYTLAVKQNQKD